MEVKGHENIPASGPVIVVSNHISNWDPMVVGSSIKRQVNFIAKEELFKIPVVGWLLKAWGVTPVKRGRGDREAISKSLKFLRDQRVIGIFIEGTRNKQDPNRMQKPQPGAAMLALKSGATVIPVVVVNTRKIFRSFTKVKVRIGKPLYFTEQPEVDKKELYIQVSKQIAEAIEQLRS